LVAHASVVFKNKMWVIGYSFLSRVLSSVDGTTWTTETMNAGWLHRASHLAVVHDNKIWMMAGAHGDGTLRDVWYSSNGVNWQNAVEYAPWSLASAAAVAANNFMVIMGGYRLFGGIGELDIRNNVYSSTDGANWEELPYSGQRWSPRYGHAAVLFDNKVWVLGGYADGVGNMDDIWYLPENLVPVELSSFSVE
jgi:leucine-zipper-like transcriptional regulator 1